MFARFIIALDALLGSTSFSKYLSLIICGMVVALVPHIVASAAPSLSRFTIYALALPGFVLLYAGLGGIMTHMLTQSRK